MMSKQRVYIDASVWIEAVQGMTQAPHDPLTWTLTEAEKQVWDDLPEFCKQHPIAF